MINPNIAKIISPDVHPRLTHDTSKGGPKANVVGEYDFLVVRIVTNDDASLLNETELTDYVFGTYGDPVNLKSQYGACSHGKYTANKSPDRIGNSTNITQGVVTITVDANATLGHKVIRNLVTDEINAQFGVSHPRDITDHGLYSMPPGAASGGAYAFLNGWLSVYPNIRVTKISAQMVRKFATAIVFRVI